MKKKFSFKVAISFLLIIVMSFGIATIPANAAVPSKNNKGIKKICHYVDRYLFIMYSATGSKGTKTINMDAYNRAHMVSYVYPGKLVGEGIETSEGIFKLAPSPQVDKFYKNLFGKDMKDGICEGREFYFTDLGLYIKLGDIGADILSYKINKITSLGNGKYQIKMTDYCEHFPYEKKIKIGYTWITVKKCKESSFGYALTKIKHKYIANQTIAM